MTRRGVLWRMGVAFAAALLAAGAAPAFAQVPERVFRLGHLANSPRSEAVTRQIVLRELARLGFVEGRNLVFDGRVERTPKAIPESMRALLANRPDVLAAVGLPAIQAVGAVPRTVPVVTFGADIVELGLAQSYARPGGNVTGVVILHNELEAKRLSILHEVVPDRLRVAALIPAAATKRKEAVMRHAAQGLGIELLPFTVASPAQYAAAFAAMRAAGAEALLISATAAFYRDVKQLASLALEARLPTVCEWADMARSGCLIGYGPNRDVLRQRMAAQIAKIFAGTAPRDIAIERPTVFEFAINRKIAETLGLAIPLAVLTQADDVIE